MSKIDKPGIYDLTLDEYHADPCVEHSLSSSGARTLWYECPAKYKWKRDNPEESTPALDFGKAAHDWLLDPEGFKERIFVAPEDLNLRTKAGREMRDEQIEAGKVFIRHEEFERIRSMVEAIKAHPIAKQAFRNGAPEKSLIWKDPQFGVWRRCRPDYMPTEGRIFYDFKTTLSVRQSALEKSIENYGYHMQARWYMDGVIDLDVCDAPSFVFIFQEKDPPYLVEIAELKRETMEVADLLVKKSLHIFRQCLEADKWPGYGEAGPDGILYLDLPRWAQNDFELRRSAGEFMDAINFQIKEAAE